MNNNMANSPDINFRSAAYNDDLRQYLSDRIDILSSMFGRKHIDLKKAEQAIRDIKSFYHQLVDSGNFRLLRDLSGSSVRIITVSGWPANKIKDQVFNSLLDMCLDHFPIDFNELDNVLTYSEPLNEKAIKSAFANVDKKFWISQESAALYFKHLIEIHHFSAATCFAKNLISHHAEASSILLSGFDMLCDSNNEDVHRFVISSVLPLIEKRELNTFQDIHDHSPYDVVSRILELGYTDEAGKIMGLYSLSNFSALEYYTLVHDYGIGQSDEDNLKVFIRSELNSMQRDAWNGKVHDETNPANEKCFHAMLKMMDADPVLFIRLDGIFESIPVEVVSYMCKFNENRGSQDRNYQAAVEGLVCMINQRVISLKKGSENVLELLRNHEFSDKYLMKSSAYRKLKIENSLEL